MNDFRNSVEMPKDNSGVRLVAVSCPRCGASESKRLFEGEDYLHRLPGRFYVSECSACQLRFQNPRPAQEELAKVYPSEYTHHQSLGAGSGSLAAGAVLPGGSGPSAARQTLRRFVPPMIRRWRWVLVELWHDFLQIRAVPARIIQAGLDEHLRCQLGYSHLPRKGGGGRLVERLLRPYFRWRARCLLIPSFKHDGRLIDLGCANGGFLSQMAAKGWKDLRGIELVPAAAAAARQAGLNVDCDTIEHGLNSFPDAHFDVIVASMVLEHVVNPFEVVALVRSKLKADGTFLFSTVVRDTPDGALFGKYSVSYDYRRHMTFFAENDLHELLARHFRSIVHAHDNVTRDFTRPARWRIERREGGGVDRLFLVIEKLGLLRLLCTILAWMGKMPRLSFSCRGPVAEQ